MSDEFPEVPGVTIRPMGGLGNQLFIYAAGLEQARRLECPLFIDLVHYSKHNERSFELSVLDIPNVYILNRKYSLRRNIYLQRVQNKLEAKKIFCETSRIYDGSINSIDKGAILSGYFQSPKYFHGVNEELLAAINKLREKDFYPIDQIGVHVRRGDYSLPGNAEQYGIIPLTYLKKSISFIREHSSLNRLMIYSDSKEIYKQFFRDFSNCLSDLPAPEDTAFKLLLRMSSNKALVMSNSTLSWWAGYIIFHRDQAARITAPSPFYRKESYDFKNLIPESWEQIRVRY